MFQNKLILFFLITIIKIINCKNICYGELGCFTDDAPFSGTLIRPLTVLPDTPQFIDVKFYLYTRNIFNDTISHRNISLNFNESLPIKVIIHGFMHSSQKKWISKMKDTLLKVQDLNVIVVDWSKGAKFPYAQASINAMVVGAEIARLIDYHVNKTATNVSMFHLIGHSLGSHVAGYAGQRVQQIMNSNVSRITGLDPAGPYFEFTDSIVRLDSSDAQLVDVIHTDGASNLQLGLGLMETSGSIDFYPNGGITQTGCAALPDKILTGLLNIVTLNIDDLEDISGCSHVAAYKFFTDSIENPQCYTSYPCESIEEFNLGNCLNCSTKGCNKMGYWASQSNDQGNLYLQTQDAHKYPFCTHNYQINLMSNDVSGLKQAKGLFTVILKSSLTLFSEIQTIDDSNTIFKPNMSFKRLLTINQKLSQINQIIVSYTRTTNILNRWLYDLQWSFKYIELFDGNNQIKMKFCSKSSLIQSGDQMEFNLC